MAPKPRPIQRKLSTVGKDGTPSNLPKTPNAQSMPPPPVPVTAIVPPGILMPEAAALNTCLKVSRAHHFISSLCTYAAGYRPQLSRQGRSCGSTMIHKSCEFQPAITTACSINDRSGIFTDLHRTLPVQSQHRWGVSWRSMTSCAMLCKSSWWVHLFM